MILRNGIDITDQIAASAKAKGDAQRLRHNDYEIARVHLLKARLYLDGIERPWCEDCIYLAIKTIEQAEAILQQPSN